MRKIELAEIKTIELEILRNFDAFCKANGIQYYLSNGTLLGAVKYRGFIPWDDDIDVLVPRRDYERLISLYQDTEKYRLYSLERHDTYAFPFAKLCDITTRKEETNIDNGTELGIDIDIFPLDAWENMPNKQHREVKQISFLMLLLGCLKMKKAVASNSIKRMILLVVMSTRKILRRRFVCKLMIRAAKQKPRNATCVGCKVWPIYGQREIIPTEVFSGVVDVHFEGGVYPAPVGYDIYLRSLYGEYSEDPPIEKQKSHHSFMAYQL